MTHRIGIIIALLLPLLPLAVFALWPKEDAASDDEDDGEATSLYMFKAVLCFVLVSLFFLVSVGFWCFSEVFTFVQAQ